MSEWSVVSLSDTDQGHRLDPEYYRPRYLCYSRAVSRGDKLGDKATIAHPAEIRRIYAETGVQILLAQNIRRNRLDFTTTVYMPHTVTKKIARNRLVTDDVVITRSGANFGDAAVYKGTPPGLHACADCLIVRPRGIVGGYLSSYLSTEVGRALLRRGAYGMAQPHIAPRYVRTLAVPRLGEVFERDIDRLVAEAYELEGHSRGLCAEADVLLAGELGLDQVDLSSELAYDACLSDMLAAQRWDADYYQPRYDVALDRISSYQHGCVPVAELLAPARVRIDPSRHPDKEFRYIEIGSVDTNTGWVEPSTILGREAPANAKIKVSGGEILASLVRPTRGAIAIVPEDIGEAGVCSGAFYVGYAPSPLKETMYVYLRVIRWILERFCTGTSYPTIKLGHVERVLAPLVAEALQFQLAAKVQESIRARKEARSLLEQAKQRVEQMIEEEGTT